LSFSRYSFRFCHVFFFLVTAPLLVFVGVVVAMGGNCEVVSVDIEDFNNTVFFTSVETRDVAVLFDTITVVVLDAVFVLEFADVVMVQGVLVVFIVVFVFVLFMGIQVCLIISAPFSAIIVVGALVFPLTM
jgi:hypothetical protein